MLHFPCLPTSLILDLPPFPQIESYCADSGPEASLNFGGSMLFIRAAFDVFKSIVRSGGRGGGIPGGGSSRDDALRLSRAGGGGDSPADSSDQVKKLKMQVQQRDNEINILVSMLQRRDAGKGPSGPALQATTSGVALLEQAASAPRPGGQMPASSPAASSSSAGGGGNAAPMGSTSVSVDDISALMNTNLLGDRNKAFELFRKSYRQNEVIEENKLLLKQKYEAAKGVGQAVNDSKQRITELKAMIEQRRVQRAMSGNGDEDEGAEDPEEARCKDLIEQEKRRYKDAFNGLRDLKKEIEHLHMLLEQVRQEGGVLRAGGRGCFTC